MKVSQTARVQKSWALIGRALGLLQMAGCGQASPEAGYGSDLARSGAAMSKPPEGQLRSPALPAPGPGEVAPADLQLQCTSPDKIYARIDSFVQGQLAGFLESNKCAIEGMADALKSESVSGTRDRTWRFVFGLSGVPLSRNEVLSVNQSLYQRTVRSTVLESWADQVGFTIQVRFPKRTKFTKTVCEPRQNATFARDVLVDSVRADLRQAADLSCALAMAGVTKTVVDAPTLCALEISDDVVSKLVETEFDRCKIEDAKSCGFETPEKLASARKTSSVCLAGSGISSSSEGKWSLLDGFEVGAGEQGFSGMVNVFAFRWGGAPVGGLWHLSPVDIETTLIALGLSPRAPPIAPARQVGVFGDWVESPSEPWPAD